MTGLDENEIRQSPLWGHMKRALAHVIRERPSNAMEALGAASSELLTGSAVPPMSGKAYADPRPAATAAAPPDSFTNMRWAANTNTALAPARPPRKPRRADGEREEEEEEDMSADAGADGPPRVDLADHPGSLSDVVAEQQFFNMVGLGLPPVDAYRVLVGLRQLIRSEPLSSARFWGVVTGSAHDYIVAECQADPERVQENADLAGEGEAEEDAEEEDEHAPTSQIADVLCTLAGRRRLRRGPRPSVPAEEAGTGLNAMCYYASTSDDPTNWTRLPDVSPHHVTTASLLRCRFTGHLDAPVHGHPRFMGRERHYLRAQIARITSACRIAPVQMFTTEGAVPEVEAEEEEDGPVRPPPTEVEAYAAVPPLVPQEAPSEEDPEAIAAVETWYRGYAKEELMQAKGWTHIAPTLLKCGRVTVALAEEEEGDQPEGEGEEDVGDGAGAAAPPPPPPAPEMIAPFLSSISLDAPVSYPGHSRAQLPAWTFRKAYAAEGSRSAVYVAKSLRWPGAATYAVTTAARPGASYQMMYYGSGLKDLAGAYYAPPLPPPCCREYAEAPGEFEGQRDCTIDEETRYAPPPPRPEAVEEGEEDGGDEYDD